MQVILETPDFQAYRGQEPPRFANRAELECAKVLDYYGVPWEYEPRTFVLEEDESGRVVEAFKPDFYLPEQDLYVEVTVMKQSLVTRKNRKLRTMRGRYVLIVEDVIDTGLTLNYLCKTLRVRDPASLAAVTLLDRPYRRLVDDLPVRYVGFTVPDELFVGFGFDLDERYRNLPDLHVLRTRSRRGLSD